MEWWWQGIAMPWKCLGDHKMQYSFRFHHKAGRWAANWAIKKKRRVWPWHQNQSFQQMGSSLGFQFAISNFTLTAVRKCWITELICHGFSKLLPVDWNLCVFICIKASPVYRWQGRPEEGAGTFFCVKKRHREKPNHLCRLKKPLVFYWQLCVLYTQALRR